MPLLAPVRTSCFGAGHSLARIGFAAIVLPLGACHDSQPANAPTSVPAATYTLGGAVSNLTTDGLVIANGSDTVTVAANATTFTLPTRLVAGASYALTVQTQPSGTLVLENGGQTVNITANGSFHFADAVAYGTTYSVQVQSKPVGLICTVSTGAGTMPAGDVSNVTVTCASSSHTIGGSITGLTTDGLVLLDNGSDAMTLNGGATSFTMPTAVADSAGYAITVGTQPYGINLACTSANNTGTATTDVTTVAITCAAATPTQTQIASVTSAGIAMDSHGNLFLADQTTATIWKIPYSNGGYGAAVAVIPSTGSTLPIGIAIDSQDNVFVADPNNNILTEYFSSTGYTISTQLNLGSIDASYGLAIDSNDNLFVADAGDGNPSSHSGAVWKYTYNGTSYGLPVAIISGMNSPTGVAVDTGGNVFVVDHGTNTVTKWPANTYSTGTTLPFSGLTSAWEVAVDKTGNVFVTDINSPLVRELPYEAGSYGSQITFGSGLNSPYGIAVNSSGRLFVSDQDVSTFRTFMFTP